MTQSTKNRFVSFIFRNVRIVFLLFLFLVISGLTAFNSLDRQGFPDVNINIAIVNAPYPNASALQVEEQIVKPIEAVLASLSTVTNYETTAGDNYAVSVVTFDDSVDLDASIASLKDALSAANFPEDALDIDVSKVSISGPVFTISVGGPEDVLELYTLSREVESELESLSGVKGIELVNAPSPEIVLTFNDEALKKYNVTREEVEASFSSAQFEAPVGRVTDENGKETLLTLAKELNSVEELRNLSVGSDVVLQDVAMVELRMNNNDRYNRVGFREDIEGEMIVDRAIMLNVTIESDADILTVDEALRDKIEDLDNDKAFEAARVNVLYNQADDTRLQIEEITSSVFGQNIEALGPFGFIGYLFGAIAMVLILLFFFMNARVAILAAMSIPLSILGTSIYLALVGIQLNTLVLFAMVLAIGLVVDPTIVFLESLQRYKEQGLSGEEAAAKTMNTVGWGVFLAVTTNLLVFIPFGIVSGFFGEIIRYIPATIIPAMIASLLIPVVFLTPFASYFLKAGKNVKIDTSVSPELRGTWPIAKKVGRIITWLLKPGKAHEALRVLVVLLGLTMPFAVMGGLIAVGALELVQFSDGGGEADYVIITADLNDDEEFLDLVYDVVVPMQDVLTAYPEIKTFQYYEQYGNDFLLFMSLYDLPTRKENEWRRGVEFVEDLQAELDALNLNADLAVETSSDGPPGESGGVQVRLFDRDMEKLRLASEDVSAFLENIEGVEEAKSNLLSDGEGGNITFVLDNGEEISQNPFLVYGLLANAIKDEDLGTLTLNGVQYDVKSSGAKATESIESLKDIEIPSMTVPVGFPSLPGAPNSSALIDLVEKEPMTIGDVLLEDRETDTVTIRRIDGKRYVQISAILEEDADAFAVQAEIDEYLDEAKLLSLGMDVDATEFKGAADSITKSFTELLIALAVAIFLIYVLLVGFFRSFIEPFIIIVAIPLGLIGVALSLAVTTGQIGFLELLGVVAMAGIVVNVTILLLDFANQLKNDEGKTAEEAISASVVVRFRPIVLTQLTAFGSLMPLMVYSPFWKGLAGAIIFGIISSALLSVFMTPILYVWASKAGRLPLWMRIKFNKLRLRR